MDSTSSPHVNRLDVRKEQILALVVREYIRTAEPIGSKHLETECGFSAATIRAEMAALTELGFLSQPHTSAGRVPTEAAYRYYIEHSLIAGEPDVKPFRDAWQDTEERVHKLKHLARILARESGGGVFMSIDDELYLTGLSFLFGQPEFHSMDFLHDMSAALDALEVQMPQFMRHVEGEVIIMVGSENPLHGECSTMVLRPGMSTDSSLVFGVLGPLRMDYDRVMPLLKGIRELMQE